LNYTLHRIWREEMEEVIPHRYVSWGLLSVAVMTLVLFFASGTYAEKIKYANRYVPHANRSLRYFNMHLNVRPQPLSTYLNPIRYLFPRPEPTTYNQPTSPIRSPAPGSPGRHVAPIAPMPPAANPRGELIFSSRVDKGFRESYERYRTAFERKRDERERAERGWMWRYLRWIPWLKTKEVPIVLSAIRATPTPSSSRRSSPAPRKRRGAGGNSRSVTPVLLRDLSPDRESTVENVIP